MTSEVMRAWTRRRQVVLFLIMAPLIVAGIPIRSSAHPAHKFGCPFHTVSVAETHKLARDEFKIVFIYVTEPGASACSFLERPTWDDWLALDLLVLETVAIKSMRAGTQMRCAPTNSSNFPQCSCSTRTARNAGGSLGPILSRNLCET